MGKPLEVVRDLMSISDEQAMWRVHQSGDAKAFSILVERWEKPIYRLCYRMVHDSHRAEDLAQETFARLFQKRSKYQNTGKFSTYLWRMALNLCYDDLRAKKRRPEFYAVSSESEENDSEKWVEESDPVVEASRNDEASLVRWALKRLPEKYRTVLILRHYEGLKLREIASILEIPEGTVNSRMAEALTKMNRLLAPRLEKSQSANAPAMEREPDVSRVPLALDFRKVFALS